VQEIEPDGKKSLHAAVHVNAVEPKVFAAVGTPYAASATRTTEDVWVDRATVTDADAVSVVRNFDDFSGEFVAKYTRIGIDGVLSSEGVEVAAAHTDSSDSHQRLTRRCGRPLHLLFEKFTRSP
jgi:hypothetical protein